MKIGDIIAAENCTEGKKEEEEEGARQEDGGEGE